MKAFVRIAIAMRQVCSPGSWCSTCPMRSSTSVPLASERSLVLPARTPSSKRGLALPHHSLGQGQQLNGIRQVVHRARQPFVVPCGPARGRAVGLPLVHRKPKRGLFQSPGGKAVRIDHGHPGFDGQGVDLDHLAQACLHLPSQLGRVPAELGLDRHGLAAVRHHQDIDLLGRMVAQDMGGIDEHVVLVPSGMPRNEQFASLAFRTVSAWAAAGPVMCPSHFICECVSMIARSWAVSVLLVLVRSSEVS